MKKPKPKPAETARDVRVFSDASSFSQPLIETALACIRQWVAIEKSEDPRAGRSANAKLRRVAELAINAEFALFNFREGGRKGGVRGSNSKAASILVEAAKRANIVTRDIGAIAKKTGATTRTVRETLVAHGKYTPQKKKGK